MAHSQSYSNPTPGRIEAKSPKRLEFKVTQEALVLGATCLAVAVFGLLLPGFLTIGNLFSLARSISVLGVLALGMAVVVIGRGIDLSQVAILASMSGVAIVLMNSGLPILVAIAIGLLLSIVIGCFNGFLVAYVEIPALFATLASGLLILGTTRAFVMPQLMVYVGNENSSFLALGANLGFGLPVPILVFIACALVVHIFLSRTTLGRFIYVHGDNADAARLTGIAVRPLTMFEYAISSSIAFVGGLLMASSTSLMHLQVAETTLIFDVILVVVLGGVSLVGGRGSIASVVVGTLLIGVLLNGMTIMNLDTQTQDMIKGAVLLGAIVLDSYLHPRDDETAKQGD